MVGSVPSSPHWFCWLCCTGRFGVLARSLAEGAMVFSGSRMPPLAETICKPLRCAHRSSPPRIYKRPTASWHLSTKSKASADSHASVRNALSEQRADSMRLSIKAAACLESFCSARMTRCVHHYPMGASDCHPDHAPPFHRDSIRFGFMAPRTHAVPQPVQ